jgi:hypothetical protein
MFFFFFFFIIIIIIIVICFPRTEAPVSDGFLVGFDLLTETIKIQH